ncbi:MAG TPA: D-glycerate dehydrogenase [Anaerolineaceae bacterium]|nr:D-glycerate dehydrogenase [Anaerolineaceae bacterium]
MPKPKIFITRAIAPEAIAKLTEVADVEVWPHEMPPPREVLLEHIKTSFGIITLLTDPIDASLIAAASQNLRVIAQMAVGFDNIDVTAASNRGIYIGHTPGVLTETTADFAWALMMAVGRRVVEGHHEVQQGIWRPWGPNVLTGQDIFGARLGLVGLGRIGQAVARRAIGFNMDILYHDLQRFPEAEKATGAQFVAFEELLERSDYVSLHTFMSPQNKFMMGQSEFACMKPNAIFINTARGGLVDPGALLWALQNRRIAGAGLDVFETEPIPMDHPLLKEPNLVMTPHIASASKQTRTRMALMAAENVLAAISGNRIPYCVNPEADSFSKGK